ncbi:MAG: homoaconitate hydratase [Planctomycetota bacterium]|nr:MAG: homoaconitate hydratase [Planctomycetota bacterium]
MARLWIFGTDVNTDLIVPGRHAPYMNSNADLRRVPFIELRPEFAEQVAPGDVLAAGPNFGCGSSREYAALALRLCDLGAIVAPSFASIFFRNAVNLGIPLVEADLRQLPDGTEVTLDLDAGRLTAADEVLQLPAQGPFVRDVCNAGGLVNYVRQHGHLPGEVVTTANAATTPETTPTTEAPA